MNKKLYSDSDSKLYLLGGGNGKCFGGSGGSNGECEDQN